MCMCVEGGGGVCMCVEGGGGVCMCVGGGSSVCMCVGENGVCMCVHMRQTATGMLATLITLLIQCCFEWLSEHQKGYNRLQLND